MHKESSHRGSQASATLGTARTVLPCLMIVTHSPCGPFLLTTGWVLCNGMQVPSTWPLTIKPKAHATAAAAPPLAAIAGRQHLQPSCIRQPCCQQRA